MSLITQLENSLALLLEKNSGSKIYLISLSGTIDRKMHGTFGIGVHFEDDSMEGGVRHDRLAITLNSDQAVEQEKKLTEWVKDINERLQIPRPPRIQVDYPY